VRAIAAIGVNRASLGVQEFSGHVQEAIGRVQPFGQVAAAVAALRAAGISALNFDLMYGLPQGFVQNASDIAGYTRPIEAGELATAKGKALSPDDKLRGRIIERLMCDFAVDFDDCAGNERFAAAFAALAPLADDGLVTIDRQRITVTQAGRPFVRLAASAFDAYLASGTGRHSHAV
jgi:oxygen-independent coproporphyrinogen-3 oxidase